MTAGYNTQMGKRRRPLSSVCVLFLFLLTTAELYQSLMIFRGDFSFPANMWLSNNKHFCTAARPASQRKTAPSVFPSLRLAMKITSGLSQLP